MDVPVCMDTFPLDNIPEVGLPGSCSCEHVKATYCVVHSIRISQGTRGVPSMSFPELHHIFGKFAKFQILRDNVSPNGFHRPFL